MSQVPDPLAKVPADLSAQTEPFDFHQQFVDARDGEQKRRLAGIKRLLEWIMADQEFRLALVAQPQRAAEMAAQRGVEVDPHLVEPIWRQGFKTICPKADYEKWPEMKLWNSWVRDILRYRDLLCLAADPSQQNPRLAHWRRRCMRANDFMMGGRNKAIVYPLFAYELSKGCSMGCWFCAFAAQRLSGVYRRTPENAKLWREILEVGLEVAGPGAAQSGFCYWATEPSDNPDYLEFLKDFRDVTGILCQTTTAAATRDLAWTRAMLKLYEQEVRSVKPRFSVLTLDILRKIHQAFTPEELLRVECIPQNPESFLCKARSGRAGGQNREQWLAEWRQRAAASGEDARMDEEQLKITSYGNTTACVSGYLVNMVERSVQLVSPCEASEKWPLGYRVLDQGAFNTAADYRQFIERTIDQHMPETLPAQTPVGLAPGLTMAEEEEAFTISSRTTTLRIRPRDHIYAQVARLIAQDQARPAEIMGSLMDQGLSPFDITGALDFFFQKGLLD